MSVIFYWGNHGSLKKKVIHDWRKNTYTIENNVRTHMLLPIEDKDQNKESSSSILLMSGKELLNEVKKKQEM
jgi:hypothetical protein